VQVTTIDVMIKQRVNIRKNMKAKWLLRPMQLFTHAQWWSKP